MIFLWTDPAVHYKGLFFQLGSVFGNRQTNNETTGEEVAGIERYFKAILAPLQHIFYYYLCGGAGESPAVSLHTRK